MSCQEYQEVEAILRDPAYSQDLFHCFQKVLDERLKSRYDNKFTRVINNDDFFFLLLRDMVAVHSDGQAEINAGEPHTEGQYFEENWHSTLNRPNPELARLNTLFLGGMDCSSSISRAESVQQVIANVEQQLPEEDATMSDPHIQNQVLQQQQAQPPASPSPEIYGTNTVHSQNQRMGAQQPFSLARAEVFSQGNARHSAGNPTSDSGESSGAQSDISSTSGRKPGGKRVAGRWTCNVDGCPKRGELMQKCRLDDHMARHQPERRTQCPSCDKIYLHSRTCNEHHKKAHGMDLKSGYEKQAYLYTQQAASLGDMEGPFTEEEGMVVVPT